MPVVLSSDQVSALIAALAPFSAVTANAGTNLNTSALALESGGHLAAIDTHTPALGQAVMASSSPVAIASNQTILPVNGPAIVTPSVSFTRPANTTAYAAGTVVNNLTAAASPLAFTGATRVAAGNAVVVGCVLQDNVNAATPGIYELYLFSSSPVNTANSATGPNDAQVLGLTTTDAGALIGTVTFTNMFVTSAAATPNGGRSYQAQGLNLPFVLGSGTTLYGLLVVRNAYTPVSAEAFNITLQIAWN